MNTFYKIVEWAWFLATILFVLAFVLFLGYEIVHQDGFNLLGAIAAFATWVPVSLLLLLIRYFIGRKVALSEEEKRRRRKTATIILVIAAAGSSLWVLADWLISIASR